MTAKFEISIGGTWHEITRAPRDGWSVSESAEEGAVSMWDVVFNDPDMDLDELFGKDTGGLRLVRATEEDYDGDDTVLAFGYTWDRTVGRRMDEDGGRLIRAWRITVADYNTRLGWRVVKTSAASRPAETDVERMTWLAGVGVMGFVDDTDFLFTTSPTNMDAVDYQWQSIADIMDDCLQQSGKNGWVQVYNTGGVDYPDYQVRLWYGKDGIDAYPSPISLSNDLDDLDWDAISAGTATVYPFLEDAELKLDPERVASGLAGHFENGTTYVRDGDTATAFTSRDITQSWPNVKTLTKAKARANRVLADLDEEEERATLTAVLPSVRVNDIRAGMELNIKATHWPGWSGRTARVLSRQVTAIGVGRWYELRLEVIPIGDFVPAAVLRDLDHRRHRCRRRHITRRRWAADFALQSVGRTNLGSR